MRLYDEVRGASTRIFPDGKIEHGEDAYVYSSSWRMTLPPFCFYPWTTVAPINRDFSKAISFRWNREDRDNFFSSIPKSSGVCVSRDCNLSIGWRCSVSRAGATGLLSSNWHYVLNEWGERFHSRSWCGR